MTVFGASGLGSCGKHRPLVALDEEDYYATGKANSSGEMDYC